MIILALAIGALCLFAGYQWGFGRGQSFLEREIVNHVINSPHYSELLVDGILKSLKRVKK